MSEASLAASAVATPTRRATSVWKRTRTGISLRRRDILGASLAIIGSLLAVTWSMQLWHMHLHVPLAYGSDELQLQMYVESLIHGGWIWHIHGPGAPFGLELFDYPQGTDSLNYLSMKIIGLVFNSSASTVNVFFLFTYVTDSLSSYLVLRWMGVSIPTSIVCSILFTNSPYHLFRGEVHLLLSSYPTVPIGTYLTLSVLDGRWQGISNWRQAPRSRRARRQALWLLVLCVLMGSLGVYYGLFMVMLLLASGAAVAVGRRSWRAALPAVVIALGIFVVLFANDIPSAVYRHDHGTDVAAAERVPQESELYALKLTDMVLPVPSDRIAALGHLRQDYESTTPLPSEDSQQTLGFIATIGLAWLFILGFGTIVGVGRYSPRLKRHRQLAFLAMLAFLIGTVSSLSAIIGYFISAQIRAYDRISIVIAFFCIAAVALGLDALLRGMARRRGAVMWSAAALAGVLVIGTVDQSSRAVIPPYAANTVAWNNDQTTVDEIESVLPDHSEIFEMPFVPFPENPPVNLMQDYDEGRGDVHTNEYTWSYGAMKGRPQDWGAEAENLPLPTLLDAVAATGFRGLWIDRDGYTDLGASLQAQLAPLLKQTPLHSPDGRFLFYDLTGLARRLQARYPESELLALKRALLYPAEVNLATPGFYNDENGSYWTMPDASAKVDDPYTTTIQMEFSADVFTLGRGRYKLALGLPDGTRRTVVISHRPHRVRFYFSVAPGDHTMTLDSTAPVVSVAGDPRHLAVRYENLIVQNAGLAPFMTAGPPAGG